MWEENTIKVWAGCFAPFRMVTFDGEDWSTSLEEMNAGTIDTTRLFRVTLSVDVGVSPFSLLVLFDGTLVLPAYSDLSKRRALSMFNKHLTDMLLGGMLVEEVAPDDVVLGSLNRWGYHRHLYPTGRYSKLSQCLRTGRAASDETVLLFEPEVVSASRYATHNTAGSALSRRLPRNLPTVFLPACTAYTNEKWERALILGWTSIELVIDQLWSTKVLTGQKISGVSHKRRRAFLSDTRTWSASTRMEMLWQLGHISEEVYALADTARAARNSFVHSAEECSPEAARSTIDASLHIIAAVALEFGLDFDRVTLLRLLDESTTHFRSPIADEHGRLLVQPRVWWEMDPAPGFRDWGDRPFEKTSRIAIKLVSQDLAREDGAEASTLDPDASSLEP